MVKVKGTANLLPPDEDIEISILAQFADYLSPEVCAVTVDDNVLFVGVSTNLEEDNTPFFVYIPISILKLSPIARKLNTLSSRNLIDSH